MKLRFFSFLIYLTFTISVQSQTSMSHIINSPIYNESGAYQTGYPVSSSSLRSGQDAVFEIIYKDPQNWGIVEKSALEKGLKLWEDRLAGLVSGIRISVEFKTSNSLSSTQFNMMSNIDDFWWYPYKDKIWLPTSLIKKKYTNWRQLYPYLSNLEDIVISFNSDKSLWFFGTDAHPSNNKYDFVTAVIREITKGLGFATSVRSENADITYGWQNKYYALDKSIESLFRYKPKTEDLRKFVQGQFPSVTITRAWGVNLFTPNQFQDGVSLNYTSDEEQYFTKFSYMKSKMKKGEANHIIDAGVRCELEFLGWKFIKPASAPSFINMGNRYDYYPHELIFNVYSDGATSFDIKHSVSNLPGFNMWTDNHGDVCRIDVDRSSDENETHTFEISARNQYGWAPLPITIQISPNATGFDTVPRISVPIVTWYPQQSQGPTSLSVNLKKEDNQISNEIEIEELEIISILSPSQKITQKNYRLGSIIDVSRLQRGPCLIKLRTKSGKMMVKKSFK